MNYINKIRSSELLRGSFWTIIGSGLSRVIITIGTVLSSNVLGVEKFGEFSITRSTINVIMVIAGLNISVVLTKSIANYRESDPLKCAKLITLNYLSILLLTLILAVSTFFLSDYITEKFLNNKELSEHFQLSSVILVFAIIFSLNESIYRGLGYYKKLGVWQIVASISYLIFVPLGAYKFGVKGAIIGYLIYTFVMTIITVLDLRLISKKIHFQFFSFQNLKTEFNEIKNLTLPIFLSSIIEAPVFWLAQTILIKYSGMSANGVASALLQTRNLILIIPGYISLVVLPILSNNLNNKKVYKKNFDQALKVNTIFSILCILPFLLFPKFFLGIYGAGFKINFNYLDSFLAYISIPFFVIANVYQQSLVVNNKGWNSLFISIIWNSILIIFAIIFCKYFKMGITGYMLSLLLAIISQMLLRFFYDRRTVYK